MVVGFPDAGVGPGGNPDWNPHTKNGLPWSVGNRGSPLCDSLESGKALLVEDLLHQISGSLGKCELAEARIDGSEVGVEDLVESVVVLHDVSFRTTAWFLASFFLLYIVRCVAIVLFFLFFVLLLFFCCAFTIRTSVCVWHAAIVISIVKSSGYLEENVITVPA